MPKTGPRWRKISAAIAAQHGFAPQVLLLDAAELREAMANSPYPEAKAPHAEPAVPG